MMFAMIWRILGRMAHARFDREIVQGERSGRRLRPVAVFAFIPDGRARLAT
jgi:hypothetical protein